MIEDINLNEAQKNISVEAFDNLSLWLTKPELSIFRAETLSLVESKNYAELEDAFYKRIEIGTGGIRGPIGVGPNRINVRTIGEAAQGLSHFISDFGEEAKKGGVVVGYEARKFSRTFAELSCAVFAANGIHSYIFESLRATPETSFAVRHLQATAGVQLTASHNPRTDNGFKFYWSDGGQVVSPLDLKFMELVSLVQEVQTVSYDQAVSDGLISVIGDDIDQSYFKEIKKLTLSPSRSARIVYSPMHGAGSTNVLPILRDEGFDVTVVPEQASPDENFPTAKGDLINPEYPEVMELPIALAERTNVDLAIMSDPDADRIGVASRKNLDNSSFSFLTGNEVGVALTHFILSKLKEQEKLTRNCLVIETYVTTTLISDIAKSFEVKVVDDLLVGFKFIGEIIEKLPEKNDFVFAAEESLGYLRGSFVRDKDAAIAGFTLAELVSTLKDDGKTLIQYLDEIYKKHSYYKNILVMTEMKGRKGFENRDKIMKELRHNPPTNLGGFDIIKVVDRLPEEKRIPENYKCGATGDQLTFILSADEKTRVTARPSGTEPKMKYYVQHQEKVSIDLAETKQRVDDDAKKIELSVKNLESKIISES